MNRKTLLSIFRQIIIDFAFHQEKQVNSFVVLNKPIDLLHTSFGAAYGDFLSGQFWSRGWVNQGASANSVQGEFPLLSVEQRTTVLKSLLSKNKTFEVYLMIADKLTCDSCPPQYQRTPEQINANTAEMMDAFLRELASYGEYEYQINFGGTIHRIWASSGRISFLQSSGYFDAPPILLREMSDHLFENSNYQVTELKLSDGYFGHGLKLLVDGCEASEIEFNYAATTPETIAQTICDAC